MGGGGLWYFQAKLPKLIESANEDMQTPPIPFRHHVKRKPRSSGDTFYLDEVFVKSNGEQN